jgi:hypothetical protein
MDNIIYIIMIDDRPHGYFKDETELETQLTNAKKFVIPQFEFNKYFFWHEMKPSDEDIISKWKCISIDKNDFMRYEQLECILEVVKTSLIEPLKEEDEDSENDP